MNATECYQRILDAAEAHFANVGLRVQKDRTALRMFRSRTYKMKSRLDAARAAVLAIKSGNRPPCLR
jgi:hypothetical protein